MDKYLEYIIIKIERMIRFIVIWLLFIDEKTLDIGVELGLIVIGIVIMVNKKKFFFMFFFKEFDSNEIIYIKITMIPLL